MALALHARSTIVAGVLVGLALSGILAAAVTLFGVPNALGPLPDGSLPAARGGLTASVVTLNVTVTASPMVIDAGQSVSFTCSASGGVAPYNYSWAFGDGANGSGPAVTHVYVSPGNPVATCTATDFLLDSGSASVTIAVDPAVSVRASVSQSVAPVGTTLTFTATPSGGSGNYTSYAWSFGDGSTGTGPSPTHAYSTPGTYSATVVVTDSNGGNASGSVSVTIESPILVKASVSLSVAPVGTTLTFTATATGGSGTYTSYAWAFGDGGTGSGPSTTHVYRAPGTYNATVVVTDSNGLTGSGYVIVTIESAISVVASVSQPVATVGTTLTFTATASGGSGNYTSYAWSFGDGSTGTGQQTTHAYFTTGTYNATVVVTDSNGAKGSGYVLVTIDSGISVSATVDHPSAAPGTSLTFTATATGGTGTYTSYAWDFGDGLTGTGATVHHIYTAAGSYTASVVVTDSAGATGTGSVSVSITAISVTAGVVPTSGTVGTIFNFSASATGGAGGPYTYTWAFGDGSTAVGSAVSHSYSTAGNYTPYVTVSDPLGATSKSSLATVPVSPDTPILPLNVVAQASASAADVGEPVGFTCNATGGLPPYNFAWTFGDGNTATGPSVSHTYAAVGSMTATCTVTDALATDQASASTTVVISPAPTVSASVDHRAAAPGRALNFSATASGGSGNFIAYAWTFGDSATGAGPLVQHAYAAPGSYVISVVVRDSNGGTATATVAVTISYVKISAYASATFGTPGSAFNFTAFGSGGAGAPYTYVWDFGDGTTGAGDAVSHVYSTTGNFTPTVRATDPLGETNLTKLPTIVILSTTWVPGGPLNATVLVSAKYPMANQSILVQALGRGGTGAPICSWDFGDTKTATGCSVTHAWVDPGNYSVLLTVRDSGGNQTSASALVHVDPALVASFIIAPTPPVAGQPVSLTAQVVGGSGLYNCTWDFGDSNHTVGCTVTHAWSVQGRYIVGLVVLDTQGHRISILSAENVAPNAAQASAGWAEALLIAAGVVFVAVLGFYFLRGRAKLPASSETKELDLYLTDLERFTQTDGKESSPFRPPSNPPDRERGRGSEPPNLRSSLTTMASSWMGGLRNLGSRNPGEDHPEDGSSKEAEAKDNPEDAGPARRARPPWRP